MPLDSPLDRREPRPNRNSARGARENAAAVAQFWSDQGYTISVRAREVLGDKGGAVWGIRSNLVNGLPRNWRVERGPVED